MVIAWPELRPRPQSRCPPRQVGGCTAPWTGGELPARRGGHRGHWGGHWGEDWGGTRSFLSRLMLLTHWTVTGRDRKYFHIWSPRQSDLSSIPWWQEFINTHNVSYPPSSRLTYDTTMGAVVQALWAPQICRFDLSTFLMIIMYMYIVYGIGIWQCIHIIHTYNGRKLNSGLDWNMAQIHHTIILNT